MKKSAKSDIMLQVDKTSATPIYQQIYNQMSHAIRTGILTEGTRAPSIRSLCTDLQISHITVEKAYQQLALEGYVRNVPRSGFVVEHIDTEFLDQETPDNTHEVQCIMQERQHTSILAGGGAHIPEIARYDFSYYDLEPGSFPIRLWQRIANDVLLSSDTLLSKYPAGFASSALQQALAHYLKRTRGVHCVADQVLLFSSSEVAIQALLELFNSSTTTVGHEEPGWNVFYHAAHRAGFHITPIPTVTSIDEYFTAIKTKRPQIVFVTPSHQYPTGRVMSLDARIELLKLAEEQGFYIIEDDSCSEYRYETNTVPSLQSLDAANRVIYLGTFSKVLSPALRISYLVLPPQLLRRYVQTFSTSFTSVSILTQEILAHFIEGGHLDQQVRRMTTSNHRRHDELLRCLTHSMKDRITISGIDSGMHFLVSIHNGMNQRELIDSAWTKDVRVYQTSQCWFSQTPPHDQLMIGFSAIDLNDIEPGVHALTNAWF